MSFDKDLILRSQEIAKQVMVLIIYQELKLKLASIIILKFGQIKSDFLQKNMITQFEKFE